MIVGGIVIRIRAIWYPTTFTFDEPFFVPTPTTICSASRDTNDIRLCSRCSFRGILLLGLTLQAGGSRAVLWHLSILLDVLAWESLLPAVSRRRV